MDEMQERKALLERMRARSKTFYLFSFLVSCLGWLLAYISHSLMAGIFIQMIAIAIPTERYLSMRRYAKYLISYDVNKEE